MFCLFKGKIKTLTNFRLILHVSITLLVKTTITYFTKRVDQLILM